MVMTGITNRRKSQKKIEEETQRRHRLRSRVVEKRDDQVENVALEE